MISSLCHQLIDDQPLLGIMHIHALRHYALHYRVEGNYIAIDAAIYTHYIRATYDLPLS